MIKRFDIICVGEALVDFIGHEQGKTINNTRDYHRYLGGSPTNVAMNLARLGLRPAVVASVGEDGFGNYIIQRLQEINIDTTHIKHIPQVPTSTVFVSRSYNTPDFVAYRAADCEILEEQIPDYLIDEASIFHTTCFALSKEPARSAILKKAKRAYRVGCKLSIDINYSEKIWKDREQAIKTIKEYCSFNPLVKISEDDMDRFFNKKVPHEEILNYFHDLGVHMVCLTLGSSGVKLSEKGKPIISLPAIEITEVLDTTGAGDAFWSGFLFAYLKEHPPTVCLEIALRLAALKLQNVGRLPNNINIISEFLR